MLELLFKTFETIVGLLKSRETNKEQLLSEIIEPLYEDLEPLIEDYFILFRQSRDKILLARKEDLPKLENEIRNLRENFLLGRIKVREVAKTLKEEISDNSVRIFSNEILGFFNSIEPFENNPKYGKSEAANMEILLQEVITEKRLKDDLIIYINLALKSMESKWIEINKIYLKIRLKYLNPNHIKYLK